MSTTTEMYKKHLEDHINNIKKGYAWLQKNLPEYATSELEKLVAKHDESKWSEEEFLPYTEYFYGDREAAKADFESAWLHHAHNNPHHWEYWLLYNPADNNFKCYPMPLEYILEMILDWWSFSWKKGDLFEIFDWYQGKITKGEFKFDPDTRKTVENILLSIKDKLQMKKDHDVDNDLIWNVYVGDFNGKCIEKYNIFDLPSFKKDVVKAYQEYSNNFSEFSDKVKRALMYYFWSKCEWEVILTGWPPDPNYHDEKIDVYDQVCLNWDTFIVYVWNRLEFFDLSKVFKKGNSDK